MNSQPAAGSPPWLARARLVGVTLFAAALGGACGGAQPLSIDNGGEARDLSRTTLARGVLAYAGAWLDGNTVTIELDTAFHLRIRAPRSGELLGSVKLGGHGFDLDALAVDEATATVFVGGKDRLLRAFVVENTHPREVARWRHTAAVTALAVIGARDKGSATVVFGDADGNLCEWSPGGDAARCHRGHFHRVAAIVVAADGATVITAGWDGRVSWWHAESHMPIKTIRRRGSANALAISPDGTRLAVGWSSFPPERSPEVLAKEERGEATDRGASFVVYPAAAAAAAGEIAATVVGLAPVTAITWVTDRTIATGGWDRQVRLWTTNGQLPTPGASGSASERPEVTPSGAVTGFGGPVRGLAPLGHGAKILVTAWINQLANRSVELISLDTSTLPVD